MAKHPTKAKRPRGRPKSENSLGVYLATRVSPETDASLRAAAQRIDQPAGWIIRSAIIEWLERHPAKK